MLCIEHNKSKTAKKYRSC